MVKELDQHDSKTKTRQKTPEWTESITISSHASLITSLEYRLARGG